MAFILQNLWILESYCQRVLHLLTGTQLRTLPSPVVLDQDYPKDFTDWRKHPNLFAVAVWNPTNWQEPDGRSFFGWRFMNRDENLDRWVAAKFEWDAANDEPDIVPRISTSLSCCPSDQNRYYAP